MKRILLLQMFLFTAFGFAQVGVNTTTPHPSSMLDITSTNKGVLVPRVSLPNVTTTQLDGTNTAATGLLIWNTNVTTTGGNGVGFYFFNGAIWIPLTQAVAGNTLDQSYDQGGAGIGKNINATDGSVRINGDDGFLVTGTFGTGNTINTEVTGAGTRMFFNPRKAAFRAGNVFGNEWDDANIGDYSIALGKDARATNTYDIALGLGATASGSYSSALSFASTSSGFYSVSLGKGATASGWSSSAFGSGATATGYEAIAIGYGTFATGMNSFAIGNNTTASGINSMAFGNNLTSESGYESVFGIYNTDYTPINVNGFNTADRLFVVGNGTNATNLSNALTIYKDGRMNINDAYTLPTTDGTNGQVMQTNGAGIVSWANAASAADDQQIDILTLTGDTLNLSLQDDGVATQTLNLSAIDNQQIDVLTLTGDQLNISLQDDGVPTQTLNLASIDNQATDVFSLTGTTLNLSLQNDGVPTQTVNLASLVGTDDQNLVTPTLVGTTLNLNIENGTGTSINLASLDTDNQQIDVLTLTGDQLNISLQDDGVPSQTLNLASIDNQATDIFSLTGTTLNLSLQNDGVATQTVNLASLDTDNQIIDVLSLTGDLLNISLQDDGLATQTLNLAAIDNQATDVFSLTGTTLNLSLQNDGVATQSVDLSSLDTDNQIIDAFSLTGTTLNLSLENDAMATQTVDLSSIVGDDDWTDVGTDIERQTGDVYIGDTSATNNNLYISNQIIDWDNTTYFLDPATANRVNEVQFDNGSATDPSITFTEQNTGFFSPYTAATAYSANGTEAFRIQSNGNIAIGQTIDPNYSLSVSTLGGNSNIEIGNKDINENVMNIFHNGDRANALNVAALSSYNLASRSSISATNTLGASAVDIARFETVSNNTYGVKSIITNNPSGIEYGIYSEALQANGFAGYFLGRMSIGTTTANNYILPPSRGTNGQIMQTDAAGNVSWVNPPTDTDDQGTDVFSLTGNTLNLSLQNDGVATQTVDLSSLKDADWYEVGGTISPDAITDNKFTLGDISIGKTTAATAKVDIDASSKLLTLSLLNTNTNPGIKVGISNQLTMDDTNSATGIINGLNGNANFKTAIQNNLAGNYTLGSNSEYAINNILQSTGNISTYGLNNMFSASSATSGGFYGVNNQINGNNHDGLFYGLRNITSNTTTSDQYGVYNNFSGGGSGIRYGVNNFYNGFMSGDVLGVNTFILGSGSGTKYGERIQITENSGGVHYGIYADVIKSNSYAGYFLGRVSVGTTIANNYILPPSRGLNGQIMQTDGAGNVSWTNAPTTSDADWYEVGGTNPANSILDNIYTGGDVSIGKATAATGKVDIEADNKTVTLVLENNNTSSGVKYGILNSLVANSNNSTSTSIYNAISGNANFKSGINNVFSTNNTGTNIVETGINNSFNFNGNVSAVGCSNFFNPLSSNSGDIIGYLNSVSDGITGYFIGLQNTNNINTNNTKTGLLNSFGGAGSGAVVGIKNELLSTTTGEQIGIDTNISSTGTGLKYGEKIEIDNTSGGIHFGVFSDVTKANSFAGYFLGRVSIGTTIANNYILPSSRGTVNQIMITDGVGTVSWVNPSAIDDQSIDVLSLTGNTLNLSLQDDGAATQTLDLSPVANTHWSDATTYLAPTAGAPKDVLIGATSVAPTAKLTVNSNSGPVVPQVEIIENQANDDAKVKFSNAVELTNNWSLLARSDDTAALNLFNINHTIGGNIVRINGEGRVGIMRAAATNAFEVGGDASKTTAGAWLANSDGRLKKNISTISPTDALNKVLSLRGVNYEWNDDKTGMKRPVGNQIGFVAQEIQEVFPEKVSEDKLGYLQTAYGDYDPIIFQAIKALNDKIEKLEKENQELKKLVERQK